MIAVGLRTNNGTHTLADVTFSASGATESYGIYNGWRVATPIVNAHQSRISGGTYSIYSIGGTIQVGASQLDGPGGDIEHRVRALRRLVRCGLQPAFAGLHVTR